MIFAAAVIHLPQGYRDAPNPITFGKHVHLSRNKEGAFRIPLLNCNLPLIPEQLVRSSNLLALKDLYPSIITHHRMPCYDMENVADFAITANIADSTIYMPTLTPVQQKPLDTSGDAAGQSSCAHPAQLNGVTYHRYVNMRGPIVAGEINHSIIGGTEHASVPPTSRSATGSRNDRSEHFHIKNCDSWVSAGKIERSVIVHGNADHDQAKSEERAFRDASDGPSSSLDPPGSDNQKLDPKQSGGSTRGAPQGPAISTRRGRGHADNAESLSLAIRLKRAERHALAALKRHKLETSVKPTGKTPKARPFAFTATTEYTPFDDDPMLNWQYTSSSKTKL